MQTEIPARLKELDDIARNRLSAAVFELINDVYSIRHPYRDNILDVIAVVLITTGVKVARESNPNNPDLQELFEAMIREE